MSDFIYIFIKKNYSNSIPLLSLVPGSGALSCNAAIYSDWKIQ